MGGENTARETEGRWVPGVEPGHATGKSKEGYSYEPSFELLILFTLL